MSVGPSRAGNDVTAMVPLLSSTGALVVCGMRSAPESPLGAAAREPVDISDTAFSTIRVGGEPGAASASSVEMPDSVVGCCAITGAGPWLRAAISMGFVPTPCQAMSILPSAMKAARIQDLESPRGNRGRTTDDAQRGTEGQHGLAFRHLGHDRDYKPGIWRVTQGQVMFF